MGKKWTADDVKNLGVSSAKQTSQEIPVLKKSAATLPTMGELTAQSKLYAPKEIPVLKKPTATDNVAAFKEIASGNVTPKVSSMSDAKVAMGVNAANFTQKVAEERKKQPAENADNRKWFDAGGFSDGYQTGDFAKTHLGTMKDIRVNTTAGILGMGEKIVDAGAYLLGGAGGLLGADDYQSDMQKFIEKDLYDEEKIAKIITPFLTPGGFYELFLDNEEYSFLGDKTDSLLQSGGQVAATAALQSVGVPWWLITGTTSFGGEAETALREGATYGEAGLSGAITMGADILTEKLSGGIKFGGKTLDDGLTKVLSEKISNKVVNAIAQTGVAAAGEGLEEVSAGVISNLGTALYKEEDLSDILFSEQAMDEYIESFIGGAALGGGVTGVNQIVNISNGTPQNDGVSTQTETSASDVVNVEEKAQKEFGEDVVLRNDGTIPSDAYTVDITNIDSDKTVLEKIKDVAVAFYNKTLKNNKMSGFYKNQIRLSEIPKKIVDAVRKASGEKLDISPKFMALEGSKFVHLIESHSDSLKEANRDQIPMSADDIPLIIETMYNPDVVEYISTGLKSTQRQEFALIKETEGYMVVVENVGGKSNPHIVPEEILHLTKRKMQRFLSGELSIADIIYDNHSRKGNEETNEMDKKNRVTAAQLAPVDRPPAHTSETSRRSPLSTNSIPTSSQKVNNAEMKVRSYNESIVEKTDLPEEVKNEFITNPQMYEVLKNKTTQEQAQTIIENSTTEEAFARFNSLLDQKAPVSVPLGYYLSKKLIAEGRTDTAVEVLRSMSTKLTEAGQFTQAAAITLMQGDPVTALKYITRELDNLNAKGREQFKDKWKDFELTAEEKAAFSKLQPGDTEGIKAAYQSVFNRIQKEYPSTMKEKLLEFRRVAMLLNTRTNVRNVVSNALLMPVRWTTDRVSALGQNAIRLFKPDFQATQAVVIDKKSKQLASEAWETVRDSILETGNKYDDAQQAIRDKQVFKGTKFSLFIDNITGGAITKVNALMGKDVTPSLMESARNLTYWLLGKGDDVFVKKNFESRMASYIAAQKITDLESIPADAYTLATQEALKATFKDDTALSKTLSGAKKNLGIVGEVVLPFTKTPANLAMRGIDYSPAGLIRDIASLAKKKNRTHADVTQAMDNASKGVVGTGAIALGYILAKAGIISGALSDDKDEAAFQQKMGMLPYAVHIGQNYYSYDWAQPAAIPLILGATIYQSTQESDSALNAWTQGTMAASNAWLELSPLQNVQNIFGGYGTPMENLAGELADMPSSLIPAQLGAISRVTDTTQRQTYSNGDFWKTRLDSAVAKIPVLNETLPASYDTWGNEIKRSNSVGEAAFAQLINPGQLGNASVTPIDDEIIRLYSETGNNAVFPKKAAWTYTFNGESRKLDNVTYSEMQKKMGQTAYELATGFINTSAYETLDDNQRAEILSNLYGFAEAMAKSELLGYDIANNTTYKKYYKIYNDFGLESVVNYQIYKMEIDQNGNGNVSGAEAESYLGSKPIPRLEKAYWFETFLPNNKTNPFD